jgi:hypothetical protein
VFIGVHLWVLAPTASAQRVSDQEVAVNLAEGRVVICAAKDAIVLAAMGTRGEAGSRPPGIVAISPVRIGVMMGAVEWVLPDSGDRPVQLDGEFKGLVAQALSSTNQKDEAFHASDIESIGIAVLERLRVLAAQLHHKINLGEDEPLVRIVLAGWVPNYGAEAWVIDYQIQQDALGNDLWRTRVSRPRYNQLYPPEKGKPKTLMESRYPPENRAAGDPEVLDLLQQNDSRLAQFRAATPQQEKSLALVAEGQSQKSDAASLVNFFKAALPAIAPPETKLYMAKVDYDGGFQWIIQPPKAPAPPASEKPSDNKTPEEPDRPSLRRKNEN